MYTTPLLPTAIWLNVETAAFVGIPVLRTVYTPVVMLYTASCLASATLAVLYTVTDSTSVSSSRKSTSP